MTDTTAELRLDVHLTESEWQATMADECLEGLTAPDKWLSPVWFYDEAGSRLFDEITRLPEYYPTRAEAGLLETRAREIADVSGADTLVELGSGTSDKTVHLLDALDESGRLRRYVPFDVSGETIREAADRLLRRYPDLEVHAVVGDFHRHLGEIPTGGRRVFAFLGGTIGNLGPVERSAFLAGLRHEMTDDDHLLLGADLVKDRDVLVAAYDDAQGVTAAFNRNALRHVNDRFGADFDPDRFRHVAQWNAESGWIEMRLRADEAHHVDLGALGTSIRFDRHEELRTEISAKFTPEGLDGELADAEFSVVARWEAEPGFLLTLARPR